MKESQLHLLYLEWASWHRSRRLFAPPVPPSLLARLQPLPASSGEEPDAACSARLSLLNTAILAQPEGNEKLALYLYYIHRPKNLKWVAEKMGISRNGFYKQVRACREQAHEAYLRLVAQGHLGEDVPCVKGKNVNPPGLQNRGLQIWGKNAQF